MQKRFGIVGLGIVGRSVLKHFQNEKTSDEFQISVWDQKILDPEVREDLVNKSVQVFDSTTQSLEEFVKACDFVVPSPGVNLNNLYAYKDKFICELDIFHDGFKKPTIAVSGSLGKTTTTKILGKLTCQVLQGASFFRAFEDKRTLNPFIGGNVGLGMLDAIQEQSSFDLGVLEISSFQLEFSKRFAPHIAVLTNCFPNHLDRHKTLQNYLRAKLNLLRYQSNDQFSIISEQFLEEENIFFLRDELKNIKSQKCFTFVQKPDFSKLKSFDLCMDKIFYKDKNNLTYSDLQSCKVIFDLSLLPDITFIENWIQIIATLYLLGSDMDILAQYFKNNISEFEIDDHHHRVEYFTTIQGVDFYDDSKATVIQSTLAATKKLAEKGPVILILGGLGKGVDRSPLCQELAKIFRLKKVYCFGPECDDFVSVACKFNSLDEILADIKKIMRPGDQVILSPSGTSFDFYKNYKERGQVFKSLVSNL